MARILVATGRRAARKPREAAHSVKSWNPRWDTADEKTFIDGLGQWNSEAVVHIAPRTMLLQRYLASMASRIEWLHVDAAQIRRHVLAALAEENK